MADDLAVARDAGTQGTDPSGAALPEVYLNTAGHDVAQLTQKFLLGAVTLNQGLGKYLKVIEEQQNTTNYKNDASKNYTAMEHYWDEAFGYFGAARDYAAYTDDEIAGKATAEGARKGYHDANGDGKIDLKSEYNFGNSVNAAKRDRSGSTTDFTKDAWDAWVRGRAIITAHVGKDFADWSDAMKAELRAQVTKIGEAWEGAVAATALHYINDTAGDMAKCGQEGYSYKDHAKHWGEMKGFALGLVFNPNSPLHEEVESYCYAPGQAVMYGKTQEECTAAGGILYYPASTAFVQIHAMMGDAPVLCNASTVDQMGYSGRLSAVKRMMVETYGFNENDADNVW